MHYYSITENSWNYISEHILQVYVVKLSLISSEFIVNYNIQAQLTISKAPYSCIHRFLDHVKFPAVDAILT